MPRPRKGRRVCELPQNSMFGPVGKDHAQVILMTVDEYETIRLIDFEGLKQEECATVMEVARTTVQRMYNDARKKIAKAMVEGSVVKIEGGDYVLCTPTQRARGCGHCRRRRGE